MTSKRRSAHLAALMLAIFGAFLLILFPMGTTVTESASTDGSGASFGWRQTSSWLLLGEGPGALYALVMPILFALIPFFDKSHSRTWLSVLSAVLLGVFVVLGMFSVGAFFLPAFVVAVWAIFQPGAETSNKKA